MTKEECVQDMFSRLDGTLPPAVEVATRAIIEDAYDIGYEAGKNG